MDTESQWEAAATGDTDGERPGDPNGGEVGNRADFRGGLPTLQLWIPSEESATQALEAIRDAGNRGCNFVVDADIQGYFDGIDRDTLMELVKERVSDRRVLKLMRQWLEAGVMEEGRVRETLAGTPQGGEMTP